MAVNKRMRKARAERKRRKMQEQWGGEDPRKWARCFVCKRKFCVNNYADHKVRVNQHKFMGKILCIYCRTGNMYGKRFVQMFTMMEHLAKQVCPRRSEFEGCKCQVHTARRLVNAHLSSIGRLPADSSNSG